MSEEEKPVEHPTPAATESVAQGNDDKPKTEVSEIKITPQRPGHPLPNDRDNGYIDPWSGFGRFP